MQQLSEIKGGRSFREFIHRDMEAKRRGTGVEDEYFWGSDGYWPDHLPFLDDMEDHGWYTAGTGSYGIVFANDYRPYVVKIFAKADRGYSAWINWCAANQNNTFVPKIYGRPKNLSSELAAVRIERLEEGPNAKNLARDLFRYLDSYSPKERVVPNKYQGRERLDFIRVAGFIYGAVEIEHDLHNTNVLQRSNGQPVVTDPLGDITHRGKIWDKLSKIGK